MIDPSRRRALYVAGVLPSLLLLLLAARIVVLLLTSEAGLSRYAAERYAEAADRFAGNAVLNPFQRWVAPFNEGDALFRQQRYAEAVGAFDTALDRAPSERRCRVRVNLALSHERVGDLARDDDLPPEAAKAYRSGREALAPCVEPGAQHERRARRVDRRLERKLHEVDRERSRTDQRPVEDLRRKQRELERRMSQALRDRFLQQQRERSGGGSLVGPPIKRW